jgi:hypothetical protein
LPVPCEKPKPAVQNITAWTQFWVTAKDNVVEPDNLATFQLTLGSGVTLTDAVNGQLLATVPPIKTYMLPDSVVDLIYDVKGKDAAANIWTVQYGILRIWPTPTRAIA